MPVGNVHTGATPPWLMDDDSEEDDDTGGAPVAGPSLEAFLSHSKYCMRKGVFSASVVLQRRG